MARSSLSRHFGDSPSYYPNPREMSIFTCKLDLAIPCGGPHRAAVFVSEARRTQLNSSLIES